MPESTTARRVMILTTRRSSASLRGRRWGIPTWRVFPRNRVGLLFHPDFIRGTSLGQKIKKYTFFSYESNEALHLSEEERMIVLDCLEKIRMELRHAIDKHTKGLIATNIELLLDYCMRFYERQFVTRGDMNLDVLARFERLL